VGQCNNEQSGLAGFGHTQKDAYKGSHSKEGAVPPTDPIGLDPTKPGEATASVQQLLPGCYSETGRIAGAGLLQPDMGDIPYPRLDSFLPYQRF
jgi:hypothetical protein